jgi:hypothetical protein
MTLDEIIRVVRANVDKLVIITPKTGEADLALVLTVDDEGLVYDLASLKPEDRKAAYWTSFSEIADVRTPNSEENSG